MVDCLVASMALKMVRLTEHCSVELWETMTEIQLAELMAALLVMSKGESKADRLDVQKVEN